MTAGRVDQPNCILLGNPLGYHNYAFHSILYCLKHSLLTVGSRNKNDRDINHWEANNCLSDAIEDGHILHLCTALTRRNPSPDPGSVFLHEPTVEDAFSAGNSLHQNLHIPSEERHGFSTTSETIFSAASCGFWNTPMPATFSISSP